MKSNLAGIGTTLVHLSRYSWVVWALLLLTSMALSLGAGIKWDW